jgi:hypothetical protein
MTQCNSYTDIQVPSTRTPLGHLSVSAKEATDRPTSYVTQSPQAAFGMSCSSEYLLSTLQVAKGREVKGNNLNVL